jgi:hypothetical protein
VDENGQPIPSPEVAALGTTGSSINDGQPIQLTPAPERKLKGVFGEPPTLDEMMSARRKKKAEVENEIDEIEAAKAKR